MSQNGQRHYKNVAAFARSGTLYEVKYFISTAYKE